MTSIETVTVGDCETRSEDMRQLIEGAIKAKDADGWVVVSSLSRGGCAYLTFSKTSDASSPAAV